MNNPPPTIAEGITIRDVIHLIIGSRGQIAPPGMCGSLVLPIIKIDQLDIIRVKEDMSNVLGDLYCDKKPQTCRTFIEDIVGKLLQFSQNEGSRDKDRAINYLILRADVIYKKILELDTEKFAFETIYTKSMPTSIYKAIKVIFKFRNKNDFHISMYSIVVDVGNEFPYLLSPWQQHFEEQTFQ